MRVLEGDVFKIPLDGRRNATGQIIARLKAGKSPYFVVVFDGFDDGGQPSTASPENRAIALQAITFDVLIRNGRWPKTGHANPTTLVEWPEFKVMTNPPNEWVVVNYLGERLRRAGDRDIDVLPLLTTVSPIRLENAARALAGLATWDRSYDLLLPPSGRRRLPETPENMVRRLLRR